MRDPTPEPELPKKKFQARDLTEEMTIFYDFLAKGIDAEDISFFHKSYEGLLSQEALQVSVFLFGFPKKLSVLLTNCFVREFTEHGLLAE